VKPVRVFEVLDEAEADGRALEADAQSLWAGAKSDLRRDAQETFVVEDAGRLTSGLPIYCLIKLGETTAIFVYYKYAPASAAVVITGVEAFPKHDEKPVSYTRRDEYLSA
jgi:hypothetical protein